MTARIRYGCTVDTGKLSEEDRADIAEIETASSDQPTRQVEAKQPAAAPERRPGDQARLIFASFLMLFVELALIRWVTANNVYVTKATNFVLIASFLGIGIGFLNARSQRDYLRWTPVALLALVGFVLAFPVILASLAGPHPLQGLEGTPALPQPVSLAVVFLLTTGVMAGLGQAVARLFVRFKPLSAYRLDIAGSIAGIAVFSGLSFLDLPPAGWGIIAGCGLVVLLLPRVRWWQIGAVAGIITLLVLESVLPQQRWSPYNKLAYIQTTGKYPALNVSANNIPYQAARGLPALHAQKPFYFYPYRHVTRASLNNVLIIGSGTGNDAAVALSEGAKHVDAVEIDPVLPRIGPAHPAHRGRPRVPAEHEQEIQPHRFRAARLAERARRAVRPPPGELPAHRAVARRGQVPAGPRRHVRDVQLLRAVPVQPVRHHAPGRLSPGSLRRGGAAAGRPPALRPHRP